MINYRLRKGVFGFCKMLSHFYQSLIPPVVPDNSLKLQKKLSFSLQKSQFFYCTRPAHVAKISLSETNDTHIANRISRIARTEAQDALFDYLHCTRSLQFTDAEHMSKNSPAFVQNLISKVGNEQEIGRSLSRFLRYHPINEFEPFFESLGLKPSEFSSLLPRNLMFLSDDDLLLENFHVLCYYGIPRSKIGKMYKEARQIFRYEYGVLDLKLRAYEELGLSKSMVIKLVICCPSLLIGGVNAMFLQVLEELKSFGIEYNCIQKRLSDKNTYHWDRMLETLAFLNEMGCSKNDIGILLKNYPGFLFDDSGRKVYVLVSLLMKLGVGMNEILDLLLQHPRIVAGNFSKNLWQAIHFLYEIGMETEDIGRIVQTHPHVLGSCVSLRKPQVVLSKLNIGCEQLCDLIKMDPIFLSNLASRSKFRLLPGSDKDHEKTAFLLRLGFVENSDEMTKALKQFRGRGDQLQDRFDCLVNTGLDCHDVSNMIKTSPSVLNQSREVIEMKIDHLINSLGYPLESVIPFPTYLCYDIERIKLRFSMYNWLRVRGAVRPVVALSTILACSEARFMKYVVSLHSEGPEVWERLKKQSCSS